MPIVGFILHEIIIDIYTYMVDYTNMIFKNTKRIFVCFPRSAAGRFPLSRPLGECGGRPCRGHPSGGSADEPGRVRFSN